MLADEKSQSAINLKAAQYYFNRELSWLEFNYRVLHEALDQRTPLLERLKFTSIFSSNLDEFLMIRMSALRGQIATGASKLTPDGRTPKQQYYALKQRLQPMVQQQHQNFEQNLRPQLAAIGVNLLDYHELDREQRVYCQSYFETDVFPLLTPLGVDSGHPFPHISNLSFNLAVIVKNSQTGTVRFARIKIPENLPRFLEIPTARQDSPSDKEAIWNGIPLEQLIAHNLPEIFPGLEVQAYSFFRVTRNADFPVQESEADDLLLAIQKEVEKRHFQGFAIRLEISAFASELIHQTLREKLNLQPGDIYEIEGLLNLGDLMSLMALPLPEYKDQPWKSIVPHRLQGITRGQDLFREIRQGDLLVHHPYECFSQSVEMFLAQAALDPDVLAIKMTLYRTYCASCKSPIIKSLIDAAKAHKQVAVLVELKARFDEETNILWAKKLEEAGVHVIYGLVGLKTHTKIALVVRKEDQGIRRYVHISTGNYNPKSAKIYTDLGLFSCRQGLGKDINDLFNFLTGYSQQQTFRQLLIAPINMRDRLMKMIQREIAQVQRGYSGKIIAKMNSLVDPGIIAALYRASQAGVKIELIVRGICCLRPGIAGVSDNIRVISIVGRFLEHSRIFYFQNHGSEEVYFGSADWMPRNLDRRVETVTPIKEARLITKIKEILEINLADNRYAWELQADGTYLQRSPKPGEAEYSAQHVFMDQLRVQAKGHL
ncbi:MAG: polyphosphate kinase 1 [Cyanobacteria bacterium P01_C01_bin.72]